MTIKIAICGAGYIANIHAEAIKSTPNVELIAVVEYFPEKAKTFAAQFKIANIYATVEELIAVGGVDAIIIATPNFLHAPQANAALQSGIHVMVEKPMAFNSELAASMLDNSQKSGALLMVAHCWRFDEEVLWLKQRIREGKIGKPLRTKGYGVHVNWGPAGWFTQKELAGGGALMDMGIHAIDTARFLLGDPKPISVFAHLGTYYQSSDVEDTGIIIINWDNGVCSYIETGWWQPHCDGPEASTQIYATHGFGSVFPTLLQTISKSKKILNQVNPGFQHPRAEHCQQAMYNHQLSYFVGCIQSGLIPIPGGAEGLVNMKIIDAAYMSNTSGKSIDLCNDII